MPAKKPRLRLHSSARSSCRNGDALDELVRTARNQEDRLREDLRKAQDKLEEEREYSRRTVRGQPFFPKGTLATSSFR